MPSMYNHVGAPVLIGCGAINDVGKKVKSLGCKKVLIIHDKNLKAFGMIDKVTNKLGYENISYVCFDGVLPDPPDTTVEEAASIARAEKVDGIIAIGGGSAIDTAKAVNVLVNNPSPIQKYFAPGLKLNPGVPAVFIPTTSGTGSEVTGMAIITDTKNDNVKRAVTNHLCIASLAIVDPELTFDMPASLTASTGMDAFAHAAEALTSSLANPIGDALARESIKMISKYLPIAVKDGLNKDARENMSCAATLAGMAFTNARVHLNHSIGHVLGAVFHIPHGVACTLAIPAFLRWATRYVPEKVRMIGQAMGCTINENAAPQEIGDITADAAQALAREVGIPTMKDLGMDGEIIKTLVPLVKDQGAFVAKPGEISDQELLDLLIEAYEGTPVK